MSTTTSYATVSGMLDIASGVVGLIGGFMMLFLGLVGGGVLEATMPPELQVLVALPLMLFVPMAGLLLLSGVFAVAGGFAALQRTRWWLAVVGSVAALVTFFPLGILAMIFTVAAEREFQKA